MANINFDDFEEKEQKVEQPKPVEEGDEEEMVIRAMEVTNLQFYLEDYNVLFDFIHLPFKSGMLIEVWMSRLAEGFKMRVDTIDQDDMDNYNMGEYLDSLVEENLGCLECKTKFLEGLCKHEDLEDIEGEEDPDEED